MKQINLFDIFLFCAFVEPPSAPGKPYLLPGLPTDEPDVVTIKWQRPRSDNGSSVIGFIVEHRRT